MLFGLTPEQEELQRRARMVADEEFRLRAARVDQTEEFPTDNVQTLVRERFMGLTIPQQYGGCGRPVLDVVLVIEPATERLQFDGGVVDGVEDGGA